MAESPEGRAWQQVLGSHRLLVSGFGSRGGGLYDVTSGVPVALDDLPTSGIGLGDNRLWRVLRAPAEQTATCELLSYDDHGVRTYQRLDAIRDPHDVCWHDGGVHITSSWDSTIWRLDNEGSPAAAWWGGAVPDSWHINSLIVVEGRLLVCAFGRFDRYKGWKSEGGKESGFLLDTTTGSEVLSGLAHPHSPRWVDDRWYVCESTRGMVTECAADGQPLRRADIRRFTRGLAVTGRWAFVGGNSHREHDDDRAEVAVVDRATFEVTERIPMPCAEIYDIMTAPRQLARAVAVGFGVNPARAVAQHRDPGRRDAPSAATAASRLQLVTARVATKLAAAGQRLDRTTALRCGVSAELPEHVRASDVLALAVTVENRSGMPLATVPPHPIRIGARWFPRLGRRQSPSDDADMSDNDDTGDDAAAPGGGPRQSRVHQPGVVVRNPLTALPELLHPDAATRAEVTLEVPDTPGCYELRVALHQAGVGWFGRRTQRIVTVVAGRDVNSTREHEQSMGA